GRLAAVYGVAHACVHHRVGSLLVALCPLRASKVRSSKRRATYPDYFGLSAESGPCAIPSRLYLQACALGAWVSSDPPHCRCTKAMSDRSHWLGNACVYSFITAPKHWHVGC